MQGDDIKEHEPPMKWQTDEYFEPYCQWKKDKELDTIEIDLAGFKREDVKVTIKPSPHKEEHSIISVTAEFPRRLRKEIEIPNDDYDVGRIEANFFGRLNLKLPKKAASNKMEISKPKFEITKFLQESADDMQKKMLSAVEYFPSKPNVAAFSFMLLANALFAYKYYTECYNVDN